MRVLRFRKLRLNEQNKGVLGCLPSAPDAKRLILCDGGKLNI